MHWMSLRYPGNSCIEQEALEITSRFAHFSPKSPIQLKLENRYIHVYRIFFIYCSKGTFLIGIIPKFDLKPYQEGKLIHPQIVYLLLDDQANILVSTMTRASLE